MLATHAESGAGFELFRFIALGALSPLFSFPCASSGVTPRHVVAPERGAAGDAFSGSEVVGAGGSSVGHAGAPLLPAKGKWNPHGDPDCTSAPDNKGSPQCRAELRKAASNSRQEAQVEAGFQGPAVCTCQPEHTARLRALNNARAFLFDVARIVLLVWWRKRRPGGHNTP